MFVTAIKRILRMCGHALNISVHERLDAIEQRGAETDNALLQASLRVAERIARGSDSVIVDLPGNSNIRASERLIQYLYSHLRSRCACFTVEPSSDLRSELAVVGYEVAVVGRTDLGTEIGVWVGDRMPELTRSIPEVIVIPVKQHFLDVFQQMRDHGYSWFLIIHRTEDGREAFYANQPIRIDGDHQFAFFFREHRVFTEARLWASSLLARTYFCFGSGHPKAEASAHS